MEKYNIFLKNIAKVVEAGLISSKDLKKEVENALRFKIEELVNKLNLINREEFEIQKKVIEKLNKRIKKLESRLQKIKRKKSR